MPNIENNRDFVNDSPTMQSSTQDYKAQGVEMKHNTKNFNKFSYFIQGIDLTEKNLDSLTPYVPGISRLFMHRRPPFMAQQFKERTDAFKSYFETGYKSVQGIGGLSATEITIEGGWAAQSFSNISAVKDDTDEITIQLYEQTGSPVRSFIELWMTGMRDPRSGVAHYHGAIDAGMEYSELNHTAEFVYCALDPTARQVEYACLFAHCWPTRIEKDHLNYESGQRNEVLLSIPFKATKYEGKYVNDLAMYYLAQQKLKYNYLDFRVFADGATPESSGKTDYSLELDSEGTGNTSGTG